jgi:putative intracellular protease/amidase
MNTSKRIVFVLSNQATSELTGWPIGFWLSELAHPYWEFVKAGYQITLASPAGGEVQFDSMSDPEKARPGTPPDFVSMGFKAHPATAALLTNTKPLDTISADDYEAIFVVGGLGPMYTFIDNSALHQLFAQFYESGKIAAAICHGTCILLKTKLSNGNLLAAGKEWTGFANAEEDMVDAGAGKTVQPFRIEDEAAKLPTKYISGPAYKPFAVADGNLITGQQGSSGAVTAQLVIAALG